MTFTLTDDEWALLENVPRQDVIDLAASLDMLVPEKVDIRELFELSIPRMLAIAQDEGLPFSKYDQHDLEALAPADLAALAELQGTRADVKAVLRQGQRVYKQRQRNRRGLDPFAYMVPILLGPLVRAARGRDLDTPDA